MRTRALTAIAGMVTTFALLAGCAPMIAGSGTLPSTTAGSKSAGTVIEQGTVTETRTVTVQPSTQELPSGHSTSLPPTSPTTTSDTEIRANVSAAVGVVNTYWTDLFATWEDDFGNPVAWWQPQLLNGDGFFDSTSDALPRCGDDADTAGNAFFCGSIGTGTGYMAWDMEFFREYSYLGAAVFYMVVAHETAHAAQTRFQHDGEAPAVLVDDYELQADCIGGATLAKAEADGYLAVRPGELEEMTRVSRAMGDYSGDSHGTPEQRDAWFQRGYRGDIESCLGER